MKDDSVSQFRIPRRKADEGIAASDRIGEGKVAFTGPLSGSSKSTVRRSAGILLLFLTVTSDAFSLHSIQKNARNAQRISPLVQFALADASPMSIEEMQPTGGPSNRYQSQEDNQQDDEEDDPSAITYRINLQLAELAKECARTRSIPKAIQALKLLRKMKEPDTVAYNSVLKAFAKVSPAPKVIGDVSAAQQAEDLLQEMKKLYAQQRKDNQDWYVELGDGNMSDEKVSRGPAIVMVKPNARSYATVMDAYARMGNRASAERTDALLAELQEAFDTTNDSSLAPNLIIYNTILSAWSKVPGGVERCQELLDEMPVAPDVISHNAVLHSVARSGWPDAGEKAEAILRSMSAKKLSASTIHPNGRTYTTVMDAWGQCGRPDKAHALLQEMKSVYEATGDAAFEPNCVSFATVIHAYAVSKDYEDKAAKAYALFQDMQESGVKPNRVTYNNLLNCCASSTTHPELIKLVESVYNQILDGPGPDQFTFGTVLKACSNLLCKEKDFAPSVFHEACERGQVSSGVLWQFRQAVPIDTYRDVVGSDQFTYAELPDSWKRNVRQDRRRR